VKTPSTVALIVVSTICAAIIAILGLVAFIAWIVEADWNQSNAMGKQLALDNLFIASSAAVLLLVASGISFCKRRELKFTSHATLTLLLAFETAYVVLASIYVAKTNIRPLLSDDDLQVLFTVNGWFGIQAILLVPIWSFVLLGIRRSCK
jgi:hypothetical protein